MPLKTKIAALMQAVRKAPSLPAVGSLTCCFPVQSGWLHSRAPCWDWDTLRVLLLLGIFTPTEADVP